MPSLLAEDQKPPTITGSNPHTKRPSLEGEKSANDCPRSGTLKDDLVKPNGLLTNGISSIIPLPNGLGYETGSITSWEDSSHSTSTKQKPRHSLGLDLDNSWMGDEQWLPEKPVTREDGVYSRTEGPKGQDKAVNDKTNGDIDASRQSQELHETTSVPREATVLKTSSVYTEPERVSERPSESSADGSLRVPTQAHRISSPPAFQNQPATVLTPYPSNRLQHRHTLEVPRLSTSRLSRELGTGAQNDEVVTATGRATPGTPTRHRGSISLVRKTTRSIHSDMHLDEVPQDEDAARWAEMIRQKRASKRKRREDEDDDRVVMGTKVDQDHQNYVTAYNMLTGIRFTVSRTNAKLPRELTDADFTAKHKFSFDV